MSACTDSAVIAIDINYAITFWSEAARSLTGHEAASMLGSSFLRLIPELDNDADRSKFNAFLTDVIQVTHEIAFQSKTSGQLMLSLSYRLVKNRVGSITHVIIIAKNITEFRQQERRVKLLEALLAPERKTDDPYIDMLLSEGVAIENQGGYDAYITLEPDWTVSYIDSRKEQYSGIKIKDAPGRLLWELLPELIGSEEAAFYQRAMETREKHSFEKFLAARDKWYEQRIYPRGAGIAVYFTDITVHKKEQQRLARLKGELKEVLDQRNLILESIKDGFYTIDQNFNIIFCNKTALAIWGKEIDGVIGKNMLELFAGLKTTLLEKHCREAQEGEIVTYESYQPKLGKWFFTTIYPSSIGLTVYFKDITHQKSESEKLTVLEMELTQSLEERNNILESIGDAFFTIDEDWSITYWNKKAEEISGKSRREVLGASFPLVYPDLLDSDVFNKYKWVMEHKKPLHFESYYPHRQRWFENAVNPSRTGISVYAKDITYRKLTEAKLLELNESLTEKAAELATSNEELERFAFVASHDLQEPLRMVTSFLTQLETKYGDILDEKGKKYIFFAADGAMRMRRIIQDLLAFSRVGKENSPIVNVDLNAIIDDVKALCRKQIAESGALILKTELPAINTYESPVRQVFQNLIGNALKYRAKDISPVIRIDCKEQEHTWLFSVSDNGIGIEKEYFTKIFVIFQRLHNRDEYSGTGIGLAITKKIVETLGGKIWVQSEPGAGSTFYFTVAK